MTSLQHFISLLTVIHLTSIALAEDLKLWYEQPAKNWNEALPVGNGFMGAMIYGKALNEHIQFNESTLWLGCPHDYSKENAHLHLDKVRALLFEGEQKEAEKLAQKEMMSDPFKQFSYQPFGDIHFTFPNESPVENYYRDLDLTTAITNVSYTQNGVNYKREVLASNPDKLIAIHVTADQPAQVSFEVRLDSPHKNKSFSEGKKGELTLTGKLQSEVKLQRIQKLSLVENPLRFESRLLVKTDGGTTSYNQDKLIIKGANSATLYLVAATSYNNFRDVSGDPTAKCVAALSNVKNKSWEEIKKAHIADYKELFNRVSIDLGESPNQALPTDARIRKAPSTYDNSFVSLVFNYGRYLMIACSREGGQPSNLQGIWNDQTKPPWNSSYTTNINTEMNYWPAEMTNLSECHEPLFAAMEELAESGAITAKNHYNCNGWVLHHNFDLWRGTAPVNGANHGLWVTGGAWLCQHLWWRYEYHEDKAFLKRAYPIMKGAAEFFVDFLIEDPRNDKGWLISTPSHSPEIGGLVAGPTMDHQIISNLFRNVISASEILNTDSELRETLQEMLPKIAPNQVGQYGQLQEWLEDKDNPKSNHRHVSHIWALHPGQEINWKDTPEFFEAAKQSLEFRGDASTGWSMGWKINFWARFLDGNRANIILKNLLKPSDGGRFAGGLYPNLLDAHPPFQIDGNFGATSGIAEMLMQNHIVMKDGTRLIHLLPALPEVWKTGSITGLKARGDLEVSLQWKNNQPSLVTLLSQKNQSITLKYGSDMKRIDLEKDKEITLSL